MNSTRCTRKQRDSYLGNHKYYLIRPDSLEFKINLSYEKVIESKHFGVNFIQMFYLSRTQKTKNVMLLERFITLYLKLTTKVT